MQLYHGTNSEPFSEFVTPTGTSEMDVTKGGVVYLTSDLAKARKYGKNIAVVEADNPISYASQRAKQGLPKKKGKYTTNVYVCLPSEAKITNWL